MATQRIIFTVDNQRGTTPRKVRLPDDDWTEFQRLAGELGTDRSAVTRDLIRWWIRKPGAKLPPRPPQA